MQSLARYGAGLLSLKLRSVMVGSLAGYSGSPDYDKEIEFPGLVPCIPHTLSVGTL